MGATRRPQLPPGLLQLANQPSAACTAIDPSGGSVVPLPAELTKGSLPSAGAGEPLDGLHDSSRSVVVSLFDVARRHGQASGEVRLAGDPDHRYRLHMFNLCDTYDCFVSVIVPTRKRTDSPQTETSPAPTPRRMQVLVTATGVVTDVDEAFTRALGWSPEEIIGHSALDFMDPESHERSFACWVELLAEPGATRRLRQQWLRKDGSTVWIETTETNLLDDPEHNCIAAELVDVSDEMTALVALREREELLARLTEALPTGVLQIDAAGQSVFSNQRWFEITELEAGAKFSEFVELAPKSERTLIREAVQIGLAHGTDSELEVSLTTPAGNERKCQLRMSALTQGNDQASLLFSLEDITESHQLQRRLLEQAERDPLTGLLNRAAIVARLEECVALANQSGRGVGVLFVDLDDFKSVNDRFGHSVGDQLLCQVGEKIGRCVRVDDVVGRLGGDEFVVVVPDLTAPSLATALAQRLEIELSSIVVAKGERLITGSVGVALLDGTSTNADELLEAADHAMYKAKRSRYRERSQAH